MEHRSTSTMLASAASENCSGLIGVGRHDNGGIHVFKYMTIELVNILVQLREIMQRQTYDDEPNTVVLC